MNEYDERAAKKARMIRNHSKHEDSRRSPEDHKRLKDRARRRAEQTKKGRKPRKRDWAEGDEDAVDRERMRAWRDDEVPARGAGGRRRRDPAGRASDREEADHGASNRDAVAREAADREGGRPDVGGEPRAARAFLVVGTARGRVRLRDERGREADVPLAPHLAAEQSSAVAIGDEVELAGADRADADGLGARVEAVRPRRSWLSRPDPSRPGRERVLAANVDVGIVVVTARPLPKTGLVDRLLLALQRGGVEPVVALNKVDLLERDEHAAVLARLRPYAELGLACPAVSATTGEGIEALAATVAGRTAVLVGHSGVGKSSLLNALAPGAALETGEVRAGDGKGRHTTTSSRLLELPDGTRLIDTPGVRAFGLFRWDLPLLREAFPDLAEHAVGCRFADCRHLREPGCAVRAAVEAGELSAARHASWLRILASFEEG